MDRLYIYKYKLCSTNGGVTEIKKLNTRPANRTLDIGFRRPKQKMHD